MNRRVPPLFTLLLLFLFIATCLAMAGWYRHFTVNFGTDMKSVTIIIAQFFLCLIPGSWICGFIADKVKKPLLIYIILSGIVAVLFFFQAPLSNLIYSTTMYATFCPFVLMIIPLSILTGSIPFLVRYFIDSINNAGVFMSRILFSISLAVIISVLLSVLVIIPLFGIQSLFTTGGIALVIAIGVSVLHISKGGATSAQPSLSKPEATKRLRFRKKRIVLETGAKLTRSMLYGSVFQAFCFAALLIIYFRILINYNHLDQVIFFAVLFVVVFAGVSAGSLLYGVVADKPANKYLTLAILQILAGITGIFSFAFYQFLAPDLFLEIHESKSFADLSLRHILLHSLIAFTPSVIHGISLPLAGRLYPKRIQQIGRTFGQLGALILTGLFTGLVITPMILIPIIGTNASYIVICLFIVLSGVYLIVRDSRLIRAFRLAFVFSTLLVFVLVLVLLRVLNVSQRNKVSDGIFEGSTLGVHYVTDDNNSKLVYINNVYYFGTDLESLREQILSASISLSVRPYINSAFLLGFNTGVTPSIFEHYGMAEIRITDVSPELIRLSASAFSDENEDIFTNSSVQIGLSDPRAQLVNYSGSYDLIYSGSEQILLYPSRYTTDFLQICRDKLTENGIYAQVLPYYRMDSISLLTFLKNTDNVFQYLDVWYLSKGRILIIASQQELNPEYCEISAVIEKLRNPWLNEISIPDPEHLLAHYLFSGFPLENVILPRNTDNHPQLRFRLALSNVHRYEPDFTAIKINSPPIKIADTCNVSIENVLRETSVLNRSLMQKSSLSRDVEPHVSDSSALQEQPFLRYP